MIKRVFVDSGPLGDAYGGESTEMMDIEGMAVRSCSAGRCGRWGCSHWR